METIQHKAEFCVVGGGLAGMAAAVAAARHGTKTVLIQDRPVLGGNASSECRMWISGAKDDVHETGYVEELKLENNYRNPQLSWSIWDSITYESVRFQPNLELILNCSVLHIIQAHRRPPRRLNIYCCTSAHRADTDCRSYRRIRRKANGMAGLSKKLSLSIENSD